MFPTKTVERNETAIFSTSSPFAGVTFLKIFANSKTAMREVQTFWENGVRGTKDTKHNTVINDL
jgi:hypothetical protein